MAEVYLVCGPPCAGKSTYVEQHKQPGDLVVDYDDIAQRLGSPRQHHHDKRYHRQTELTIGRAMAAIKAGKHERAWIIRCLPESDRRAAVAVGLGAKVIALDEPDEVLADRAQSRGGDVPRTLDGIRNYRLRSNA